ncbi:MAG: phosphoribosylamine--glycine ligase, partial [Ruthenibacterium sp.]
MKILVVGSGGREHAILRKLKESAQNPVLFAAPGNGGIAADATCVPIAANDVENMVAFAVKEQMDYVVVAPDDPLVLGMVDALAEQGIPAFGPNQAAAILEGSKVFSKNLMKKYKIPTAQYETFDCVQKAVRFLKVNNTYPIVIKADGLALGKGVLICEDEHAACTA